MSNNKMTGAALLVKALEGENVDTLFGIPGVHNLKIYDALAKSSIKHVTSRNESGAGFMADGYARISGKVGTAIVISGPGLTNILTPMGQAFHDAIPMVVISSQLPTTINKQSTGYLHELKNSTIMAQSVSKESRTITSVTQIEAYVHEAYTLAKSGKPGPVHLEVPLDILAAFIEVDQYASYEESIITEVNDDAVEKAATLINQYERVAIIAGGGACDAANQVNQLVEKLSAPILQTAAGKGIVSDYHPLCIGTRLPYQNVLDYLSEQEIIIAIGTQLAPTDLWEMPLNLKGKLIQIDIDADAFYRNYSADLGVKGHALKVLNKLLPMLEAKHGDRSAEVKGLKETASKNAPTVTGNTVTFKTAMSFLQTVEKVLGKEGAFITDMTTAAYIGLSEYNAVSARSFLHPVGFGTLGYSMPAAIGAKLCHPDQDIIALIGDGGFQFTMQELAVACTEALPLPIVIWNNDGYGEIKRNEKAMGFEKLIAVDNNNPDFVLLAKAYGIEGIRVTNVDELENALKEGLKKTLPTIIELHVDRWNA
jgi:thiamine pyrophosphate-dependent acetolactate synthase large subunit-like protein